MSQEADKRKDFSCNGLGDRITFSAKNFQPTDAEKAREALGHVKCLDASYTEWTNVGAALKSAGCSWEDWDGWSRTDPARYRTGECQRKWGSLQTQIGVGTLIDMAKRNGFEPSWAKANAPTRQAAPKPAREAAWTQEQMAAYIDECAAAAASTDCWAGRGLTQETVAKYHLGYDRAANALTMPDPTGRSVKLRRIDAPDKAHRYAQHRCDGWRQDTPYLADALESAEPVIAVEGEINALTLRQLGYNACALRGAGQGGSAEYVAANAKAAVIGLFDDDAAGRKGADALAARCRTHGKPCVCRVLPSDPNDLLTSGRTEELDAAISDAFKELEREEEEKKAREEEEKAEYAATFAGAQAEGIRADVASRPRPIPTGIVAVDRMLGGGFRLGRLHVLAAGSGMGKTTLALQMATSLSAQGHDVLYVALEQDREALTLKGVSRCTKEVCEADALTTWELDEADREDCRAHLSDGQLATLELAWARHAEQTARLKFVDRPTSIDELERIVDRHKRLTGNTPFVVLDYLQYLRPSESQRHLSSTDRARENVARLKAIVAQHRLPMLVLSSLNRIGYNVAVAVESLKDSGDIEFTADVVLGLQPIQLGAVEDGNGRAINAATRTQEVRTMRLTCLKHREGKAGEAVLEYDAAHNAFNEPDIEADLIAPMPMPLPLKPTRQKPVKFGEASITDADINAAFGRLTERGLEASQGNVKTALLETWEERQDAEGVAHVRGNSSDQLQTLTNLVALKRLTVTQDKAKKNAKRYALPTQEG